MRDERQGTRRRRAKALALGVPLLAACAVAPWLIDWGPADAPRGEPAGVGSPTVTSSWPPEHTDPSAADVRALNETVSRHASGGYDLPVDRDEVSGVSTEPGPYRALGRIRIPAIGLDVTYGEGVFADTLARGPGHWPGTPVPGRSGNAVVSGHRNTHTQPFKELDRLHPGDEVVASAGDDEETTFAVTGTEIVPEAEYRDRVLRQPEDERRMITLFACHPEGNPVYRIVVTAEAMSR